MKRGCPGGGVLAWPKMGRRLLYYLTNASWAAGRAYPSLVYQPLFIDSPLIEVLLASWDQKVG